MNAENFNISMLWDMAHSPIRNYVIPGVTSWLIGEPSKSGTMRMLHCSRDHQENVTPHSHRFDFQCWVLNGSVVNRIWKRNGYGDKFQRTSLVYLGECGQYEKIAVDKESYIFEDKTYGIGDCYSMEAEEIHSIKFSRDTLVLFFEGQNELDHSFILEPSVDGETIPTFEVKSWMFKKDDPS